jgi:hypothetical protein
MLLANPEWKQAKSITVFARHLFPKKNAARSTRGILSSVKEADTICPPIAGRYDLYP